MSASGTFGQAGGTFGGAPDIGWRYVHWSQALTSQTTGLDATPTDEANDEIRAVVTSGTNTAGAVQSGAVALFSLVDSRGRSLEAGKPWWLEWEVIPVTAPANASFLYCTAGWTDKATVTALGSDPQFFTGGVNYQPAGNPRGIYLPRFDGGALAALAVGSGSAIGTSGGRAWFGLPMIRGDANTPGATSMLLNASGTTLTNAAYNIGGIGYDSPNTTNRFMVCFGTVGGAEPAGNAAARTIGCKVRYRVHSFREDA